MRHSIRTRLTTWYAGSVLLILLAGTWAARHYLRESIEAEFARAQDATAGLVSGFFRIELAEYRGLEGTIAHIVGEMFIPDRHIHFIRPDGSDYLPPEAARAMPFAELQPPTRELYYPLDPDLAPGWKVRLTVSAASLERQLAAVDRGALLAIPLAVLAAMIFGWVMTGRTLQPLAAMANAADRITANSSGRLPIAVPDDELGRLGIRFNALLDRLDQAIATQRRFLADAAHELRTPIARARGSGDLALSMPAGAEDRAALERTQRELEVMSRLVDELLELARSDAGRNVAALHSGFLDDVVADVVRRFEQLAARSGVKLDLDLPEEAPVRMEAESLSRLVGILVDNAIRYSPNGGAVRVAVRATPTPTLIVEDNGIGIPEAERSRLFERFFRGSAAREIAPDGSGLGLPIANAIAQRHGARIDIGENAPTGTRISVRFPRA